MGCAIQDLFDHRLSDVIHSAVIDDIDSEYQVRELVGRCTCPVQFPIIKVGEGKYKIGDNQTLVFVRILRKHVMIRVGGGWDTLEHYLDRHDPCRCRFEGHRSTGRGSSTPRRASSSSISQSVPTTPKTPRKLSMTTPVQSTHSGSVARPASPGMRSPSPGPNAKKLSLVTKGVSNSQPGSCVTSPNIANKMPNFSSTVPRDIPSQSDVNGSGNFSVGNFVKQSQNFFARQLSSGSGGGTLPRQTTPRRSASPAFRSQSPGPRRSESPAPVVSDRLRSPSPIHSKKKAAHAQAVHPAHESRNGRCESPIKQITLSELRSSREGKPVTSQKPNTPRSIRRQTSTTSSNGDNSEMATDPSNPNITMDKISTMSLGEFKSLLNSALSVPNGTAGSQTSSDSPRSQTSVDNKNKKTSLKSNTGYKSASYKSAPSSRAASANRNLTTGSGYHQSKVAGTKVSEKYPESSSSGYSTSSSIIDRTAKTNVPTSGLRSRTPSGKQSVTNGVTSPTVLNKTISTSSNKSNTPSTSHESRRPRTPTSLYKSNSNSSSISETPNTLQPGYRSNYASRSSSHSSLKSYESTDSHSLDDRASQHSDPSENVDRVPLTPSSATSDYSLRNSYTSNPESPGQTVTSRANTNSSSEHKLNGGHFVSSVEKRETVGYTNGIEIREENPRNVGYAYMFSYSDKPETKDCAYTENRKRELNELENELAELTARADSEMDMINNENKYESKSLKQTTARSHTPVGRSHTPSLIPRPMTPKISRKTLTTPLNDNDIIQSDDKKPAGRPPTPKKSNIIARAPASSVRSADRGKEQTYREIFHKRSMTPGPDSRSTATSQANARRSSTPGPYLKKSNLSSTSATTTRARLNESLEQKNENQQLSVFSGDKTSVVERSRRESVGSVGKRSQSMDRKALTNQQSETVILVNRSNGQHSLDVQGENRPPAKSKVLARARNEDTRSRADTRRPITRQRPQSVEPKQLIPRKQLSAHNGQENEEHEVYNRTQEWVQTAVAQTKVQKNKTPKVLPRSRRAMTPNSFDMHKDVTDDEEPRTLEEIKAALSLPIHNIATIDPDKLDAPPEDPDAYHQMEKLFHELRQQELKNSVNETPGTSVHGTKSSKSKSKSNSSANEEDMSVDSNRNAKKKTWSVSTKSSTNVTSPACSDRVPSKTPKSPYGSNTTSGTHNLSSGSISGFPNSATKTYSQSSKVVKSESVATASSVANSSRTASTSSASSQRPPSPRTTPRPMSPRVTGTTTTPRPSSPAFKVQTHSQKSSASSTSSNPPRPSSPAFKSQQNVQRSSSNSSNSVRPSSPAFKNQTQKVTTPTASTTQRPASPAFKSPTASTRSSVSSTPSQTTRPATSSNRVKSPAPSTPGTQPSRPASTPPRPSTPVSRQSSRTSDDSVFDSSDKKLDAISGSGILSKLKEIIKVKPRKDKQDKVKTRIPAPKSLANHRKSQSFSNLTHLSDSMSLAHTCPDLGSYTTENHDLNTHPKENGWCLEDGLNATVSNKADVAQPRLMTPLNTGRSTLIRKESMDKNKEIHKMTRAMSVERNINSLNRYPYLDEGEYV